MHSHRPLDMLQDMAYCSAVSRVALGGGSTVKLLDVGAEYGEVNESVELPAGHVVNALSWGQDGQVGCWLWCSEITHTLGQCGGLSATGGQACFQ